MTSNDLMSLPCLLALMTIGQIYYGFLKMPLKLEVSSIPVKAFLRQHLYIASCQWQNLPGWAIKHTTGTTSHTSRHTVNAT